MRALRRLAHRVFARVLGDRVLGMLPAHMRLAIRDALSRLSLEREPELIHLHRVGPNRGLAVDAGANFGLYTRRLSRLYEHVVAFEPHPGLFRALSECGLPNTLVVPTALSDHAGEEVLRVPVQNGRALFGWGTIETGTLPGSSVEEARVRLSSLDAHDLHGVSFIKIDVEGHEIALVRGAMKTIARDRPVILCEAKGGNAALVETMLAPLGYRRTRLEDWIGVPGSADNWFFTVDAPGITRT